LPKAALLSTLVIMEICELNGFLLINKPANLTSFRCVGIIKRLLGKSVRVGHAGTLDQFATGLLIIGIGRQATKHLGLILNLPKNYLATGKLGEQTDTLDPNGIVVHSNSIVVSQFALQQALSSFGEGYIQVPPIYSALKFAGQRLSDLHRNQEYMSEKINVGEIAQSKSRYISLYQLELLQFQSPFFTIKSYVSSGTYIRVLINDIAIKLGSCATTIDLSRTAIGPFKLANALELADLDFQKIEQNLISVCDLQALLLDFNKG
jgi:tRNA pseudouridine55 synthase